MKQARSLSQNDNKVRDRLASSPVTAYLVRLFQTDTGCRAVTEQDFADPAIQVEAFNHRARRLVEECFEAVNKVEGDLGSAAPYAAALSVAHTQNLIVTLFWAKIAELEKCGADAACVAALKNLAVLNGLALMQKHIGEFLEDGYLSGKQAKQVRNACGLRSLVGRSLFFLTSKLGSQCTRSFPRSGPTPWRSWTRGIFPTWSSNPSWAAKTATRTRATSNGS